MARLGKINLTNRANDLTAGAAFRLRPVSEFSAALQTPSRAEAEVANGNEYIVVRHPSVGSQSNLLAATFEVAQTALDWWCVTGRGAYETKKANIEHLLWWSSGGGLTIRNVCEIALNFSVSPVTVIEESPSNDVGEDVRDQPELAATAHPGFRFFRRAQNTEGLHDAYRNLWLAFEHTLSSKFPPNESTKKWLKKTIPQVVKDLNLTQRISSIPPSDPADHLIEKLYNNTRLPLFHSKQGLPFDDPQSIAARRDEIVESYNLLLALLRTMFDEWFDARWKGGAVFPGWVYDNYESTLEDSELVVSDVSEFDPAVSDLSDERFDRCPRKPVNRVLRTSDGRPCLEASVPLDEEAVCDLACIQSFEIVGEEHPLMVHILEEKISELDDVDQLVFSLSLAVQNASQPRTSFPL